MKKHTFKTNVKCGACVAAITPEMDKLNADKWTVDLVSPERTLTVEGDVEANEILEALKKSGYQAEAIS